MGDAKFVGVDWAKGGWLSIAYDADGNWDAHHGKFAEIVERYREAVLILVDSPIGLPEEFGWRLCDDEARIRLGRRKRSVFPVPSREIVKLAQRARRSEYTEFLRVLAEVNRNQTGAEIPSPAWNIAPTIAEVDDVLSDLEPDIRECVREVHPELCFWALNNQRPMEYWKKNERGLGQRERIRVLEHEDVEPRTREILAAALKEYRAKVAPDDILDALAAAVTARLGHPNRLATLPRNPPRDARGLPMEMVYYNPPHV